MNTSRVLHGGYGGLAGGLVFGMMGQRSKHPRRWRASRKICVTILGLAALTHCSGNEPLLGEEQSGGLSESSPRNLLLSPKPILIEEES